MDDILVRANLVTSAVISACAAWAVLSQKVRDGIIVKVGLIGMSMGHGMVAIHLTDVHILAGLHVSELIHLNRARFISNIGMMLILLGYWWRYRAGERLRDLLPDFTNLRGRNR